MGASRTTPCLVVLLLLAAAPAAGQAIVFEEITVEMTSEEFTAELRGDHYTSSEAQWLRGMIDGEFGDGDGVVSQAEVDAFVAAQKNEMNEQLAGFGGAFLFNGIQVGESREESRPSVTRSITDIRFSETILGAVESPEPIVRDLDALLTFPDTTRTRIMVVFADDFRAPFATRGMEIEWEQAIFRGGAPWVIDPETIDPERVRDDHFQDGEFRVGYEEMGSFSSRAEPLSFEIVDTDEEELPGDDKKRSPAPAIALIMASLALVAVAARRRRA